MAAGAPIVCSDIHGYKGVVRRGREALLVPPRKPKALAGALATLLNDTAPGRDGRGRPCPRRGVQLGAGDRQGGRYYGFVIRRLAAAGQLPEGYSGPIPTRHAAQEPQPPPAVDVNAGDGSGSSVGAAR